MTQGLSGTTGESDADILLRYYEDQWLHIRHHESQMSNQTFQIIAFAGALLLAITQMTLSYPGQIGFSVLIAALGVNGLMLTSKTERSVRIHIARARSARKQIRIIDQHAIESESFPNLYLHHRLFHIALIALSVILVCNASSAWFLAN